MNKHKLSKNQEHDICLIFAGQAAKVCAAYEAFMLNNKLQKEFDKELFKVVKENLDMVKKVISNE